MVHPVIARIPGTEGKIGIRRSSLTVIFLFWFVGVIGVGSGLAELPAEAPKEATRMRYAINPQPLSMALRDFALASGLQVSFNDELATGLMSPGANGRLTPREALTQLLSGTDLSFRFTDEDTITLEAGGGNMPLPVEDRQESRFSDSPSESSSRKTNMLVKVPEIVVKEVKEESFVPEETATATKSDIPLVETPQSISVVTRKRMVVQEVDSIQEALRYMPGVQAEPFGFEPRFAFLRFRGFDATTNGLFKDGLQLRNPGFAVSYNLEPYGAEQIDVLRGPASFLYGQGSPGGLLNYVSKRPTLEPFHELQFLAGSFQRYEGRMDFGGRLSDDEKFSYRLTGLYRESGTQIDFVPNDRIYIAPALTYRPTSDTDITFFAHFQKDQLGSSQALPAAGTLRGNPNGRIPASRFTGIPELDKQNRTEWSAGYEAQHHFNDTWSVLQKLRYHWTELDGFTVFSTGFGGDQRTLSRAAFGSLGTLSALTVDNQVQGKFSMGPVQHTLLMGVDFQRIMVDLRQTFGAASSIDVFNFNDFGAPITMPSVFLDQHTTQFQLGGYIQDQIKFYEKLILTVGGRYDWAQDETENRLTGTSRTQGDRKGTTRLALSYLFDIGLAPYFSYSTFFLPAIGVNPSGGSFKPETGRQFELGIKFQPSGSRSLFSVALFDLTRENVVQTDPATFQQLQRGEVRSRGVEFEGIIGFESGVDLIAAYTILENEVRETADPTEKGKRLTQNPAQFGSLWVNYTVPQGTLKGLMMGGGARYTGSTYSDVANTFKVPGFVVGDAVVAYTWDRYRVALNVTNIFDHDQFTCFDRGGTNFCPFGQRRNFVGSLTYRW